MPILCVAACVAINCGAGECKRGEGLSYTCECQEGYVNLLNLTAFPCVKNCTCNLVTLIDHPLIDRSSSC